MPSNKRIELVPGPKPTHFNFKDLTGKRFGRLLVIGYAGRIADSHAFSCRCDCGNEIATRGYSLTGGVTRSCGCLLPDKNKELRTTHGLRGSDEYSILQGIKNRCLNPNVKAFPRYGGRGIKVCNRWLNGADGKTAIECFVSDMGRRPSKNHSIDRVDSNGNYEPNNCRWATAETQEENKPGKRNLTFNGRTLNVHEWSRETGIPVHIITKRALRGWSAEKTLTQPVREASR